MDERSFVFVAIFLWLFGCQGFSTVTRSGEKPSIEVTVATVDEFVKDIQDVAFPTDTSPRQKFLGLVSAFPALVNHAQRLSVTLRPVISTDDDSKTTLDNMILATSAERLYPLFQQLVELTNPANAQKLRTQGDALLSDDDITVFWNWRREVDAPISVLEMEVLGIWLKVDFVSEMTRETVQICKDTKRGPHNVARSIVENYRSFSTVLIKLNGIDETPYVKLHASVIKLVFYQTMCSSASITSDYLDSFNHTVSQFLSEADEEIQQITRKFTLPNTHPR